ncbi:hypothetical protein [Zunongwangia pacifica]|uniref:Uncharacterized protein n=1 Tax=Zunongwangia pacifica TaxID=2911062 RepID=A0A9X2CR33_9FLAO|nr:hypothetical protein [Zunongwangia pacifica]MCL6220818.1 hypothetical protein [Zunongwangia pacifica]
MRVFKEEQQFTQWWVIAICLIAGISILLNLARLQDLSENIPTGKLVSSSLGLIVCAGIFFVKMHTKIDKSGIQVWFSPFKFTKKSLHWEELETVHTRKYRPVSEFGGWGVRVFRQHKAYNVKGDQGIQLKTKEGKFFLIGTQQPHKVDRIINRYFNNSEE